jgi:hypothetical protein
MIILKKIKCKMMRENLNPHPPFPFIHVYIDTAEAYSDGWTQK